MESFIMVVCILYTINCVISLVQGFSEEVVSTEARLIRFCVWSGLAIWGWILYF